MALSSKALQQKRAKKAVKRKSVKKSSTAAAPTGMAAEWLLAAKAPIADVYTPEGLFEKGIGSIWFSRKLADGRYAMSAFLVDTFCLGVKSSLFTITSAQQYRYEMDHFLQETGEKFVARDPAYVRKLVELAVDFSRKLGLEPDADYKIAKIIFGDVDASACQETFQFGRDGNPIYFPGPSDSLSDQRRIFKQLEKLNMDPAALLTGGFEY